MQWNDAGKRGLEIPFDIETQPLQILTDTKFGSDDYVWIHFNTESKADDYRAGGIRIKFTDPPQSYIGFCSGWKNFTAVPEHDGWRVWTVLETTTTLTLLCNGVEVITTAITDDCRPVWNRDSEIIKFVSPEDLTDYNGNSDNASRKYRARPTGMLLKSNAKVKVI